MIGKKTKKAEVKKPAKKLSVKEIEDIVLKLAKKDTPLSKIGLILKNEHGVPKVKSEAGKINKILIKHNAMPFPEELDTLIKRAKQLRVHFTKNHKDQTAKRGLQLTEARIRKLGAYFRKKGRIDKKWAYTTK